MPTIIIEQAERIDANRKGHVVVELATITLLIDAGLVTTEQVAQRIEEIQSVLPDPYRDEAVSLRVRAITEWLRGHEKQPPTGWKLGEHGRDR